MEIVKKEEARNFLNIGDCLYKLGSDGKIKGSPITGIDVSFDTFDENHVQRSVRYEFEHDNLLDAILHEDLGTAWFSSKEEIIQAVLRKNGMKI
jgi:hypothetical protein